MILFPDSYNVTRLGVGIAALLLLLYVSLVVVLVRTLKNESDKTDWKIFTLSYLVVLFPTPAKQSC